MSPSLTNFSFFSLTAELKEWTLVVMGTATHPQTHNYSPPIVVPGGPNTHQLPECSGVSSQGICIGLSTLTLILHYIVNDILNLYIPRC